MYAKVFAQMYDGTLRTRAPWQAMVTFQQLLILADQDGVVDMTLDAIHIRTGIPYEILEAGIEALQQADKASRTPDEEGRRIVLLDEHRDWGWKLVNYVKYRQMQRESDRREYHAERYRLKKLGVLKSGISPDRGVETVETNDSTNVPHAPQIPPIPPIAEAYAKERKSSASTDVEAPRGDPVPYESLIALFHEHLPCAPQVTSLNNERQRLIAARWREVLKGEYRNPSDAKKGQPRSAESALRFFARYFEFCQSQDWINGNTTSSSHPNWKPKIQSIMTAKFFADRIDEALGSPA